MKVLLVSMGTRGDIEPYIGLAQAFMRENIPVSFASANIHKRHIEKYNINFISISDGDGEGAVGELLENQGLQAVKKGLSLLFAGMREAHPVLDEIVPDFDVVIGHGWIGELEADLHKKPFIRVAVSPNLAKLDPRSGAVKKIQKGFGNIFLKQLILKPYNLFRTERGGGPVSLNDIYSKPLFLPIPSVLTRGEKYASSVFQSNYWFPDNPLFSMPEELELFLQRETRKLLVTFGSMTWARNNLAGAALLFLRAGAKHGLDIIWLGPEVRASEIESAEKDGYFIQAEECPHQFLLPRVDAAAHHCGLGTTCSILQAGVVSIPVPHVVDQYDWANRLYQLGAAAKPIPVKNISEQAVDDRLETVLKNDLFARELAAVRERMNEEQSVDQAVRRIVDISHAG